VPETVDQPAQNHSIWTDVAIIARDLGQGDQSALARLFDVSSSRLLRYAGTLTRNQADAEDALQSALVRVARRPRLLAEADRPWAYLLRIVRNESLRISSRRKNCSLSDILESWQIKDSCPLEREEFQQRVRDCVRRLPVEQAEVVVLKIWEELTFAEVASLVGESPNTVASRYRYALEKLSRLLETSVGPWTPGTSGNHLDDCMVERLARSSAAPGETDHD